MIMILVILAATRALPLGLRSPPTLSPDQLQARGCRSPRDIIPVFLLRILLCTWVPIHLDIPTPDGRRSKVASISRRAGLVLLALFVPEAIIAWVLMQLQVAIQLAEKHKGATQTDFHGEDGHHCNRATVECATSNTAPTFVHPEPTHTMTTRGQFIAKGIMQWAEMEAGWQGLILRGISSPSIDTNLGMDAGHGHIVDVAAPDAQGPATMPLHAFPSSNNLQQERLMPSGMEGDQQTMLIWQRAGSGVRSVQILAVDLFRYSTSMFPTSLQVEIVEAGSVSLDIQSKIRKRKAPMARLKCAHEKDNHALSELIESLDEVGGIAVAQYDIQDRGQRFVLAPLGNDILCTVLPVSDIEELRTRRSG